MTIYLGGPALVVTFVLWLLGVVDNFLGTFTKICLSFGLAFAVVLSVWWLVKYGRPKATAILQARRNRSSHRGNTD